MEGRWKLASYRLRSVGFDGVPSDDDLCVAGQTKLKAGLEAAKALVRLSRRLSKDAAIDEKLTAIGQMACD